MKILFYHLVSNYFISNLLLISLLLSFLGTVHTFPKAELIPGQYIVKLRDGVNAKSFIDQIVLQTKSGLSFHLNSQVKHTYSTVFNGFSAKLDSSQVDSLHAMDMVEYISQDHKIRLNYSPMRMKQTNGTWGIARLSTKKKLNGLTTASYTYTYNSTAGKDTRAYIIDSGIYVKHDEFEGRAVLGKNFVAYEKNADLNGHGTHCAGVVAGKTYGVAKQATVVSVKVFDVYGTASSSELLMGMEWAMKDAEKYGLNRCVMGMSFGGKKSRVINEVSENAIKLGMTIVTAAGNDREDACTNSPASSPNVITVGASDISDNIWLFSNYGKCVDILAPGVSILSAHNSGRSSRHIKTGTSMAAPHVVGLVCYFKSIGYDQSPKVVEQVIKEMAAKGAITKMPRNTVNLLAQNDCAQ